MRQISLVQTLLEINPEAVLIEGYDSAVIGIIWNTKHNRLVALYDARTLLNAVLKAHSDMTTVEAAYNWVGVNIPDGPNAPAIFEMSDEDEEEGDDLEDPVADSDWC